MDEPAPAAFVGAASVGTTPDSSDDDESVMDFEVELFIKEVPSGTELKNWMKKQRPPIKRPYPAFVYVKWRGFNSMKDITIETRASAGGNVPDDTFDAELARMKAPRRRSAKQASLEHTWLRNKAW